MTQKSHHPPEPETSADAPVETSAISQKDEHQMLPSTDNDNPKFGRLLLVLLMAVALIVVITFATEAYHVR